MMYLIRAGQGVCLDLCLFENFNTGLKSRCYKYQFDAHTQFYHKPALIYHPDREKAFNDYMQQEIIVLKSDQLVHYREQIISSLLSFKFLLL